MINWSFLNYFIVAAREQNFSKAARELYYSQPYLSKKIAELEDDLGVALFERRGKKVTLTEAGEYLYQKTLKINQQIGEMQQDMKLFCQNTESSAPPVFVSAEPYASGLIHDILHQCRILHPEYNYELVPEVITGPSDSVDILCYYTSEKESCSEETIFLDREVVYINKYSAAANKNQLTLRDLADHTCIVLRTVPRQMEWEKQISPLYPEIRFHHVDSVFESMSILCSQPNTFEIFNAFSFDSMPLYNTIPLPLENLSSLEFHVKLKDAGSEAAKTFLQVARMYCRNISQ